MEYNSENIKVTANEISEIIREHKTRSNLIKMTDHLDKLEVAYNTILKEYKSRNGK